MIYFLAVALSETPASVALADWIFDTVVRINPGGSDGCGHKSTAINVKMSAIASRFKVT